MHSFDVHELAPPSDDVAPELELLEGNRPPSGKLKLMPLLEPDEGVGDPLDEDDEDDASSPDDDPPPSSAGAGAVASSPGEHVPHPPVLEKLPEDDCELPLLEPFPPELDAPVGWNPCTSGTVWAAHPAAGPTVPARRSPRTHGRAWKERIWFGFFISGARSQPADCPMVTDTTPTR
jgi:hypothetical protein